MKKSTFWIIVAAISIMFAAHNALSCNILQSIFGCATCCSSLVVEAWYERKEREEKEQNNY